MIFGASLESFCVRFGFVCDLMKTRKIARRLGESTKIEDLLDRKCRKFQKKNASKIFQKTVAKNDPKIEPIWMPNGAKMEAKRHLKIDVFFDVFLKASGNIELFAGGPQASHFLQPTPQGGAIISKNIVQKQAKSIACRI